MGHVYKIAFVSIYTQSFGISGFISWLALGLITIKDGKVGIDISLLK